MDHPLVSVVVPVYNMQLFLAETLDSVLKSTYPNFEVLLVDDGSTDSSADICAQYAKADSRIRFIQQHNGGASVARNTGIRNAQGIYILPVDADNLIAADYIENCVAVLEKNPQVKIVTCEAEFFGGKTGRWKLPEVSLKLLARRNLMDNCAMYRKADWEKAGGYCEEILGREDWDFWISMLKTGGDVHRLAQVGLYYRVRHDSKRKRTRHLKSELIAQLNRRHKAFFYQQLGGPLHKSRTWSETINRVKHLFEPERIASKPGYEEFVYNIPENFETTKNETGISTFKWQNEQLEVLSFYGSTKSATAAKSYKTDAKAIGYYEKAGFLGKTRGYFIRKQNSAKPKASLIVTVYKNTEFLKSVLNSTKYQTESDFEIIVTEDGDSTEMKSFIENYSFNHPYQHLTQPDEGWQKNKALNAAVKAANADWLIFIDGDCVLHPRFVEMHLANAGEDKILSGKRVKLDPKTTNDYLSEKINIETVRRRIRQAFFGIRKGMKFAEEGLFISPYGFLGFLPKMRKLNYLKGCNMSFSKNMIMAINGFDEDYILPAIGEDIDLSWRFEMAGYKHKSVRNLAVQYHLHHKENWMSQLENAAIMQQKKENNEYICKNGIEKQSTAQ
ncbi:MAG: glycosyltransferase family 2 protein [Paludibacteraceae bacterium]|nr:glycosyltransferase family 2 protein [Paludibacteraceae bacterium]